MNKMKGITYMATTADEYEIPVFVSDSALEMAAFLGITKGSLFSRLSRQDPKNSCYEAALNGKQSGYRIFRVNCEN